MSEPSSKAPAFKTPSVMRYERIQRILEGEPMLKSVLGPRDQPIVKRENEKHFFSKGAVEVTNALQQRGMDPHNIHRDIVLRVAADVLNIYGEKRSAKPEPKPQPKPEPPQTEEKAQTNEKPKASEEKKQQPTKPKIDRQIKPVTVKPKAVRPVAPPKPKVVKAKKPPVKKEPKAEPAQAPVPAPVATNGASPESVPSYYVYASAFSLAISLRNMLQVGDRSPGAEGRMAKVDAICQELNDLKHVVVPLPMDMMPPDMLKNANKAASADSPKRG